LGGNEVGALFDLTLEFFTGGFGEGMVVAEELFR